MERFNYPNLRALRAESGELLRLLELEHWSTGKDREEETAQQESELAERQRNIDG